MQAEKVFDQANQMAAEAFINIRIIAAFMLEMRISGLYQQLLAGPSKDSLKQALASGAGYAIGQGVIFLVSSSQNVCPTCPVPTNTPHKGTARVSQRPSGCQEYYDWASESLSGHDGSRLFMSSAHSSRSLVSFQGNRHIELL